MEFLKEKHIHYLHPDFEDSNDNVEKRPSPLALLAQTCKNIGTAKELKDTDKFCSNSGGYHFKTANKRSIADYSISNANSPTRNSPSAKKMKHHLNDSDNVIFNKKCDKLSGIELHHADTSSDTNSEWSMSSFLNVIELFKSSNQSFQLNKSDLLHLSTKLMEHSSLKDYSAAAKSCQFNVENGYHLDAKQDIGKDDDKLSVSSPNSNTNNNNSTDSQQSRLFLDEFISVSDPMRKSVSSIKYCMYCGKHIPFLPLLLAHIDAEHNNSHVSDFKKQFLNNNYSMPNLYEILMKLNSSIANNNNVNNHSPTHPALSDYFNNLSSFYGRDGLIC